MDEPLNDLVRGAQAGDLEAFGRLVQATQAMAYAVALGVLRESSMAQDAAQEAYLRAFRRLGDLGEPSAFISWLRRIVITIALNMRRAHRLTFLRLDDVPDVPVLDEAETSWSESQRQRLAWALLTLTSQDRRLCDRRYHGRWSTARLARDAGVDEAVMRKRLQRVRDKLRKEIEVAEQRGIRPEEIGSDFPARVVELLARPQLTDLPENPVGKVLELLRGVYGDFAELNLLEVVDLAEARKTIANDALYLDPLELQAWDLEVEDDGRWTEVLAWGIFTDRIVSHLGGDPARHMAVGVGHGLERLAMLRYGIDDVRKIEVASVA